MSDIRVRVHEGEIEGAVVTGCRRFLGIPYAQPPTGELRFALPQAVQGWSGVREAFAFSPQAPQTPTGLAAMMGTPPTTDEASCLSLNVWVPERVDGPMPVMVWVHGGSYLTGGAQSPWYDGARLAQQGCLVVTVQYRLGVLGFTQFPGELGEQLAGSGNAGIADVREALRWVQRNIGAFGGDAGNVTVFGESAGAGVIGVLLGDPQSRGLFRRAILESPAPFDRLPTRDAAARFGDEILAALDGPRDVAALHSVPVGRLLAARDEVAARHLGVLVSQPSVDGVVVAMHPKEAIAGGSSAGVDVLAGTNLDEWRLWLWMDPSSFEMTEERMTDDLRLFFGDHAPLAAATYRQRLGDVEPAFVFAAGRTDAIFRVPLLRCVDAHVAAGGRAHQYLFTYGSRRRKETLGAMHAIEIPFVFDTLGAPGGTFLTGAEPPESLAKEMSGTWVAFARGGDPSAGLFGAWPPYTLDLRTTMVIGATSRTEDDPLADERRLLMGT